MKILKVLLIAFTLFTLGIAFSACGNKSKSDHSHEMQGKEYTSAYVCPMHCEGSGSNEAGTCPVCGMDYVANAGHKSDGHKHENHGHDHGDNGGHDHDDHNH